MDQSEIFPGNRVEEWRAAHPFALPFLLVRVTLGITPLLHFLWYSGGKQISPFQASQGLVIILCLKCAHPLKSQSCGIRKMA